MPTTFNTAVRDVYSNVGRMLYDDAPDKLLDRVGWFFQRLTDWYNGDQAMVDKVRDSYWMAIADTAFSAYVQMLTVGDVEKAKRNIINLMILKQYDYGAKNILTFGERGVLVRSYDKYARLCNLLQNGKEPNYESITDTWMDMCNYGVIAVMVLRGEFGLPLDYSDVERLKKQKEV